MSNTVIKVENLSKQYRLGQIGTGSLAHDVNRWWHKIRGNEDPYLKVGEANDRSSKGNSDYVWSLRDINFEIKQGEAVGIIGRNGAGKSTLLKILSRTTSPTAGKIGIKGRVASLLEVGTGFHPELTGRENIFLNGAILGMTKAEIKKKFDEIVDFAGVERYVDTPVKRYSSGMYVRLAFGVAAHLEPEILIVDEVLAVGDTEFQKKALGKMNQVSKGEGRTVLFVSHNMAAIKTLCTHGIVLKQGVSVFNGSQYDAVNYYQSSDSTNSFIHAPDIASAPGNDNIKILRLEAAPQEGSELTIFSGLEFQLVFFNAGVGKNLDITFEVQNQDNVIVFHSGGHISKQYDSKKGIYHLTCKLPKRFLNAGTYSLSIIFGENQRFVLYSASDIISFEVLHETSGSNSSRLPGLTFPEIEIQSDFSNE
ncbi:polysaccharide ABC transporter ATP-binding protein [Pinibacter soli]|uniref:ABC transporter ATP-binding protein n=1 Tax=Pinibacter soli TaxID=3044211 RepID=A0ABT6R7W2_9BACT|nr:ABC transporter ATP-binding protein [Pinibacter soli]MDI3318642.1 ABC transporter ATP-binding protein [Pinibacter soli]